MDPVGVDEILSKYRVPIITLLVGAVLVLAGVFFIKSGITTPETKVEVLNVTTTPQNIETITVDIAGEVINPGVYKLPFGSRVDDLLKISGGLSANADRSFVDKNLNKAAKLIDGQKLYIPNTNEQILDVSAKSSGGDQTISTAILSDSSKLVNINQASLAELDTLPGIGQTYGQKIIEHRPYSNASELLSKSVLPKSVYEKVKDRVSTY